MNRKLEEQKRVNKMFVYHGTALKFPSWSDFNPVIAIPKDQEPPSIDILWTANPSAMDELGQVIRDAKLWEDESLAELL